MATGFQTAYFGVDDRVTVRREADGMVGVLQWRQRRRWRHLLLLAVPRQLHQPEVLSLSPPLPSLSPHPRAIVIRRL